MTTYTADQIAQLFAEAHPNAAPLEPWDAQYAGIQPKFIKGLFSDSLTKLHFQLNITWTSDAFDCNAFSLQACALASAIHWNTSKGKGGVAAAFGWMIYWPEGGSYRHMINWFVHRNALHYYEPQTCTLAKLTDRELLTVERGQL